MVRTRGRRDDPKYSEAIDTTQSLSASENCSQPTSGDVDWIQGDNCDCWEHTICTKVDKEAGRNIDYFCRPCNTRLNQEQRQRCPECERFVKMKSNRTLYAHGPIMLRRFW